MTAYTCNPNMGQAETRGSQAVWGAPGSVRDPVSDKQYVDKLRTDIDIGLWAPQTCTHTHTYTYTIHMHTNLHRDSLHFRKGDWSRNSTLTFGDTRYWLFAVTQFSLDLFIRPSLFGVEEI